MTPGRPKPLTARASVASAFLATVAVLNVVRVWAISTEASILRAVRDGRSFSLSEARASDDRLTMLAGWYALLFIGAAVAWCVWQHRAHQNLRAFARSGLAYTPGWAVGWWFVPIASLWKPYDAVRELWKASAPDRDPSGWRTGRTWRLLAWWWTTWLASGAVVFLASVQRGMDDIDATITGDTMLIGAFALQVVAAVLAIAIVRQVVARQTALELTGAGAPAPPRIPPPPPPMPPMPAPLD